ncbi:MAG: trehalose-phosphatase [Chloroflexi bacterium]|nr:trehalose-phosphatase [Chloroflexota bacterium]
MQYLFDAWADFSADVRAAAHLMLLSDYDGTLTPIVSRPDEARLAPEVNEHLIALSRKPDTYIGIISGRSLAEIKSHVSIEGIYYAGNHGLEIDGPGISFVHPIAEAGRETMKALARDLKAKLGHIAGAIVEVKGLSLSVHYRLVAREEETHVVEIFRQVTAPCVNAGKIKVTSGKKVWEIRPPVTWDKGKAVQTIIGKTKALFHDGRWLIIYLGDDTTDEDAFRVLHRPNGWSILVSRENPASEADYYLNSVDEVATFLTRLLKLR